MWEKNFTPLPSAQSFIAAATTSAVAGSSGAPVWTVCFIALKALFDRHSSMVARLNTSHAQILPSGSVGVVGAIGRLVISLIASRRFSLPLICGSFLLDLMDSKAWNAFGCRVRVPCIGERNDALGRADGVAAAFSGRSRNGDAAVTRQVAWPANWAAYSAA